MGADSYLMSLQEVSLKEQSTQFGLRVSVVMFKYSIYRYSCPNGKFIFFLRN